MRNTWGGSSSPPLLLQVATCRGSGAAPPFRCLQPTDPSVEQPAPQSTANQQQPAETGGCTAHSVGRVAKAADLLTKSASRPNPKSNPQFSGMKAGASTTRLPVPTLPTHRPTRERVRVRVCVSSHIPVRNHRMGGASPAACQSHKLGGILTASGSKNQTA